MRTLVISIGNTSLIGGVFAGARLRASVRVPVREAAGSGFGRQVADRLGGEIDRAVLCSVVPALTPVVSRRIARTFGVEPLLLTADAAHGLKIGYRDAGRIGADRIAAAIGARARFPGKNVIVVDCGTATTVTALRRDGALLGGAILPGSDLWARILAVRTAQLPEIRLRRPKSALGRSPEEAIASGIWYGHAGAIQEVVRQVRREAFGQRRAIVVGTGGRAETWAGAGLFSAVDQDLILYGLVSYVKNMSSGARQIF